jgi:Bacteriocin-protection, YdeI or OmpD-Associated
LAGDDLALFQANAAAWAFFQGQPAGYRKLTVHRILQGKTPGTRAKRLALLIDASSQSRRLATATRVEAPKAEPKEDS